MELNGDVIDVRDVIERFEELEKELQSKHAEGEFMSDFDDWIANSRDNSRPIYDVFGIDGLEVERDIEEFYKLRSLLDALNNSGSDEQWRGDWYPLTLICDNYFENYARELANDIGAIDGSAKWPNNCIDWKRAANELQSDYFSVEIGDITYWSR